MIGTATAQNMRIVMIPAKTQEEIQKAANHGNAGQKASRVSENDKAVQTRQNRRDPYKIPVTLCPKHGGQLELYP